MERPNNLYLVERYWPGVTPEQLRCAASRTVRLLRVGDPQANVSYLGSALIADEETVLSFFGAPDVSAVEAANRNARFRFDRIRPITTDCMPLRQLDGEP